MDTILLLVDDVADAKNAARYALHLAKRLNANVQLADWALVLKAALVLTGDATSEEDFGVSEHLEVLRTYLERELAAKTLPDKFWPQISISSTIALAQQEFAYVITDGEVCYGQSSLFIDRKYRALIENTQAPVIIVPGDAPARYAEKITFVTDIGIDDTACLAQLSQLAAISAASIMLTRINPGELLQCDQLKAVELMMREKMYKIDYGRLYFRNLPCERAKSDLCCLMENIRPDTVAITYRTNDIFANNLVFGHTQKISGGLSVPLIIFPRNG